MIPPTPGRPQHGRCAPPPSADRRWPSRSRTSSRLRCAGQGGWVDCSTPSSLAGAQHWREDRRAARVFTITMAHVQAGRPSQRDEGASRPAGPRHPGHTNGYGSQNRHHRCDSQLGVPMGLIHPAIDHARGTPAASHHPAACNTQQPAWDSCLCRAKARAVEFLVADQVVRACPAEEAPLRRQPVTVIAVQVVAAGGPDHRQGRPARLRCVILGSVSIAANTASNVRSSRRRWPRTKGFGSRRPFPEGPGTAIRGTITA